MLKHDIAEAPSPEDAPVYGGAPAIRALTSQQISAIRDAMHIFVEDDLERGVPSHASEYCPACDAPRPLPGFVRYDDIALCNACATDYEIARTRGVVSDAARFIGARSTRAARPRRAQRR